jgi:uncharacterized protein YbaR (Trm112 family)
MNPNFTKLLTCPVCNTNLKLIPDDSDGQLQCEPCNAIFQIRDGVPDLFPPDLSSDAEWETWRKHLDAFQQRRQLRIDQPNKLTSQMTRGGGPQQQAFASFSRITDGIVLDIGCGPGNFRFQLPSTVHYVGMDPIPLPEATEFDFIRGLAEHIPLPNGSVRHITVISALDHFQDCQAFLSEATRVLEPDGRLHVVQQVNEPLLSIRGLAHEVKDLLEDRASQHEAGVPHHMTEFGHRDLRDTLGTIFDIEREQNWSMSWYTPRRLFLTLHPVRA